MRIAKKKILSAAIPFMLLCAVLPASAQDTEPGFLEGVEKAALAYEERVISNDGGSMDAPVNILGEIAEDPYDNPSPDLTTSTREY